MQKINVDFARLGLGLTCCVACSQMAHAGFSLGDAANYAILYEGSGSGQVAVNTPPISNQYGTYSVLGNIGLGTQNNGNPSFAYQNGVLVNGAVNFAGAINNTGAGGTATITGGQHANVTQVNDDLIYVNNLSTTLSGYAGTALDINTGGSGGSQTVQANNGNLVNGNYVFTLKTLKFDANTTLTINGDGSGTPVVINIDKANVSDPHLNGSILLAGGLNPNNVVFNFTGGNSASLMNGPTDQVAANKEYQYGTFLDPNGTITTSSVNIVGHLFGGDSSNLEFVSNSTIVAPPVPEPTTFLAGALLLLPFGASTLRVLRRHRTA